MEKVEVKDENGMNYNKKVDCGYLRRQEDEMTS